MTNCYSQHPLKINEIIHSTYNHKKSYEKLRRFNTKSCFPLINYKYISTIRQSMVFKNKSNPIVCVLLITHECVGTKKNLAMFRLYILNIENEGML